jgi:SAM-dependent methyltransferase
VETGPPSQTALWEAAPLLRHAVAQYGDTVSSRHAMDIACGTGRNAVYLAQQGFTVTAIDWLPDALSRARDLAQRSAVDIATVQQDLEQAGALRGRIADCIVVVRYLYRDLFPTLVRCLSPGGILVYETFTTEQMQMGHPRNPLFLLQPGELRTLCQGLEVLFYEEGWHDGAHTAQLIARK